ncbi:MAG: hypothetical protein Q7K40_00130 [bacterium]|nr:hypothetical protein [bacterium]
MIGRSRREKKVTITKKEVRISFPDKIRKTEKTIAATISAK